MDLLNVLLDLADAISAGVAVAVFWCAWIAPPDRSTLPPPERSSRPEELEQFVRAAALIRPPGHRLD